MKRPILPFLQRTQGFPEAIQAESAGSTSSSKPLRSRGQGCASSAPPQLCAHTPPKPSLSRVAEQVNPKLSSWKQQTLMIS